MAAVSRYTAAQAEDYAATHDLGGVPAPSDLGQPVPAPEPTAPAPDQSTGSNCDPNYAGACLDPNASDYDCAGGSGNGPYFTGPVTVVGVDHFGLDRDSNGLGCE